MSKNKEIFKITLSAIFLSLAFVLPFLTGQIPEIGSMLCPMHIPILLCGFICGWKYGLIIGLLTPIIRSLSLGMPPMFPTALSMSLELATYGFISGVIYNLLPKKKINIYISLIISMLVGRIIWGLSMMCFLKFDFNKFNLTTFWISGFINAIPGIIIQIVLIPILIMIYEKIINNKNQVG